MADQMMVDLRTLEESLDDIRRAPAGLGTVELIVRRPADEQREVLAEVWLDAEHGLEGDLWPRRIPKGRPIRRRS